MPSTYSWETCPLVAPCHFGLIEIHSQIWAQGVPASQHAAFLSVHDNLRILPSRMHNHIWVCPCTVQSRWIIYALWARFHSQKCVRSTHKSAKRIFWWSGCTYFIFLARDCGATINHLFTWLRDDNLLVPILWDFFAYNITHSDLN